MRAEVICKRTIQLYRLLPSLQLSNTWFMGSKQGKEESKSDK